MKKRKRDPRSESLNSRLSDAKMESLERHINDQRRQKIMNARFSRDYFSEDSDNEERQNSQNSKKSEIRELAREIKTMASGNRRSGKTKPPTFKQGSNPRLFVLRFDDWVRLEQETDERAALAFKNAVQDDLGSQDYHRIYRQAM